MILYSYGYKNFIQNSLPIGILLALSLSIAVTTAVENQVFSGGTFYWSRLRKICQGVWSAP